MKYTKEQEISRRLDTLKQIAEESSLEGLVLVGSLAHSKHRVNEDSDIDLIGIQNKESILTKLKNSNLKKIAENFNNGIFDTAYITEVRNGIKVSYLLMTAEVLTTICKRNRKFVWQFRPKSRSGLKFYNFDGELYIYNPTFIDLSEGYMFKVPIIFQNGRYYCTLYHNNLLSSSQIIIDKNNIINSGIQTLAKWVYDQFKQENKSSSKIENCLMGYENFSLDAKGVISDMFVNAKNSCNIGAI